MDKDEAGKYVMYVNMVNRYKQLVRTFRMPWKEGLGERLGSTTVVGDQVLILLNGIKNLSFGKFVPTTTGGEGALCILSLCVVFYPPYFIA
jgi:hypothetical protein